MKTTKDVTLNDIFDFCIKNDVEITIGRMNDFSMTDKNRVPLVLGARFFIDEQGFDKIMGHGLEILGRRIDEGLLERGD